MIEENIKFSENPEIAVYQRKFLRERMARLESEALLEEKSLDLFLSHQKLTQYAKDLRQIYTKTQSVLDNIPSGVLTLKEDLTIENSNFASEVLLDLKRDQLHGKQFTDFIPAPSCDMFKTQFKTLQYSHHIVFDPFIIHNAKGEDVFISMRINKIAIEEDVLYLLSMFDIKERLESEQKHKRLEQQLSHVQKFETLATLSGGIAHELNNLLQPIILMTDLCLEEAHEEGLPIEESLSQIKHMTERSKNFIKQILSYSRKEDTAEFVPINFEESLKKSIEFAGLMLPKNLRVKFVAECHDCWINAHPQLIDQIVINLMLNAKDAIPSEGGLIEWQLKRIERKYDTTYFKNFDLKGDHYIVLMVTDNGCGIPPHIITRVFDPFFTTKEANQGTGLGLSMIQNFVYQMGGKIFVRNSKRPNMGAEFLLFFPLLNDRLEVEYGRTS